MRKSIFMFCCFLATSCFFTGCEEAEVKKSSTEIDYDKAMRLLYEQYPEFAPAENARTQSQALTPIASSSYEQGSTFELRGAINYFQPNFCYPPNLHVELTFSWMLYNATTQVWSVWGTKSGICAKHGDTKGTYGAPTTTSVLFFVVAYRKAGGVTNEWGRGTTNTITLKKPY